MHSTYTGNAGKSHRSRSRKAKSRITVDSRADDFENLDEINVQSGPVNPQETGRFENFELKPDHA